MRGIKDAKGSVWTSGAWTQAVLSGIGAAGNVQRRIARQLAFVTCRLACPTALLEWQPIGGGSVLAERMRHGGAACGRCAPNAPTLQWVEERSGFVPAEDPYEAGEYERAMKNRPPLFLLQLRADGDVGSMRVAVNVASLAERAFAALPPTLQAAAEHVHLEWRLCEETHAPDSAVEDRHFHLLSNKSDSAAPQPPGFVANKMSLRPEQLRSLQWMLAQEATSCEWVEQEVVDETLSALGWRVEVMVEVPMLVRGGVLADAVGYGKTAISLGLIDAAPKPPPPMVQRFEHKAIPVKATLIIVPKHLMKQWPSELKKFIGERKYSHISLFTNQDLNNLTIQKIMDVDVIFMGISIFRSQAYFERFAAFACTRELPTKGGRYFNEAHAEGMRNIEEFVGILTRGTSSAAAVAGLIQAQDSALEKLESVIHVYKNKKDAYKDAPKRGQREAKPAKPQSKKARVRVELWLAPKTLLSHRVFEPIDASALRDFVNRFKAAARCAPHRWFSFAMWS